MGERNNPDRGETTLAAATAAIITARWQQTSGAPADPTANGHASSNGHGPAGGTPEPPSPWAPPVPPPDAGLPPVSPSLPFASPDPFAPVSPAPAPPVSPAPSVAAAAPVSPAEPAYAPAEPTYAPAAGAQAGPSFFSPAEPEPVPEVFGPRVPTQRDGGLPRRDPYAARDFAPPDLAAPPEEARTQVPPGFERRTFGPYPDEPPPPAPDSGATAVGQEAPGDPAGPESPAEALLGSVPPSAWAESVETPTLAPPEPTPWVDPGWADFGDLTSRPSESDGRADDAPPAATDEPASSPSGGAAEPAEAPASASAAASAAGEAVAGSSAASVAPGPVAAGATAPVSVAPGERQPLPRRVPRVPDVDFPLFASDPTEPAPDPATERHELNRIADYLRDETEAPEPAKRPDGIDLGAVLAAVRQVPEVRDAQLRWNAQAGHTLRIEFVDGVDESEVTKQVVRLLRNKLGLGAQPSTEEPTVDTPFRGRAAVGTARVPNRQPVQTGRGRPLPRPSGADTARLVVENVTVTRLGAEATVEVRLRGPGGQTAVGEGQGPGVDAYLCRLAATAASNAVNQVLTSGNRGKVFIEHVSVVPFGVTEVAVVVLLFSYDGVAEQLSGSAIVGDDPHQAVVRATLAALNRRLEALL
jgi:hypothetical protein